MKVLFSVLAFFTTLTISAQNFEGILTYRVERIKIDDKRDSVSKANSYDTFTITYKNGHYREDFISNDKSFHIYLADSNKTFFINLEDSTCKIRDESNNDNEQSLQVNLLDTLVKVDKVLCKVVRAKYETGYYDYYFSEDVNPISPQFYSEFVNTGWNKYLAIAKALPIKKVTIFKTLVPGGENKWGWSATLIKTDIKAIDKKLFKLPAMEYDYLLTSIYGEQIMQIIKE